MLSQLSQLVDSYLELRRSTGFRMGVQQYLLHGFASFAAQRGETHIRTRTAIEWAAQAPSEGQRANRLGMLRVFARFARAEDAGHEVPSERVFCSRRVRYRPFIFTPDQLHELLVRASKLPPAGSIRPWTYTTLFSLLAVTGLRISDMAEEQVFGSHALGALRGEVPSRFPGSCCFATPNFTWPVVCRLRSSYTKEELMV